MCLSMRERHLKHCNVKCVGDFSRKKREIAKHLQKKQKLNLVPCQGYQDCSNIFKKSKKFVRASWASVIMQKDLLDLIIWT